MNRSHTNIHSENSSIISFMPVDNVTACQSWSYIALSQINSHFYFWTQSVMITGRMYSD